MSAGEVGYGQLQLREATPAPEQTEAAPEADVPVLRAVTWDFEAFPGGKAEASEAEAFEEMAGAKAALREMDPDILLMQRVRHRKAMVELIAGMPGMQVAVVSRHGGKTGESAICTKLPVLAAAWENWEPGLTDPPNGFCWATLELPGGAELLVYTTRLRQNSGNQDLSINMREDSVEQMLRHIRKMREQQRTDFVMVGGSFNTTFAEKRFEEENSIRRFVKLGYRWCFEGVPALERVTVEKDAGFARACVDHFFTLNLGRPTWSIRSEFSMADHYPVELAFRVPQQARRKERPPATEDAAE